MDTTIKLFDLYKHKKYGYIVKITSISKYPDTIEYKRENDQFQCGLSKETFLKLYEKNE